MNRTEGLSQLIKSLTPAEKRNFKLYSQLNTGKQKNYEKLFDAIERQPVYDEKKLISQFCKEKFVKQFAVAKNYLYNNILRSLAHFHKDDYAEFSSLGIQVRVLIDKALYPQALKILRKCQAAARKQELFAESLQLYSYEREIMRRMDDIERREMFIGEIQREEKIIIQKIQNLAEYQFLNDGIIKVIRTYPFDQTAGSLSMINSFDEHHLMSDQNQALSVRAKIKYWRNRRLISRHKWDLAGEESAIREGMGVMENNPGILADLYYDYILMIGDQVGVGIKANNDKLAEEMLAKLNTLEFKSAAARLTRIEVFHVFHLTYALYCGDMIMGKSAVQQMEEDLKEFFDEESGEYQSVLPKTLLLKLYYTSSYIEFIAGDYSKALRWINSFLNEPRHEVLMELQSASRLLNLLIHLEIGNFEVVENKAKSEARFMQNIGKLRKFEKAMLKSITRQIRLTGEDLTQEYRRLLKELYELYDDKTQRFSFTGFDAISWLRSKLEEERYTEFTRIFTRDFFDPEKDEKKPAEIRLSVEEAKKMVSRLKKQN